MQVWQWSSTLVARCQPSRRSELTDAQAQVWRNVVSSMSADWLIRGAFPVLIEYTRHVCRARLLEAQIAHFETQVSLAALSGSTSCLPWRIARRRPLSLLCSQSAADTAIAMDRRAADRARHYWRASSHAPWE